MSILDDLISKMTMTSASGYNDKNLYVSLVQINTQQSSSWCWHHCHSQDETKYKWKLLLLEKFLRCVRTLCIVLCITPNSPVHSNAVIKRDCVTLRPIKINCYVALKWEIWNFGSVGQFFLIFFYCIVHEFKLITKCTSFVNQSTMTQSKENIQ